VQQYAVPASEEGQKNGGDCSPPRSVPQLKSLRALRLAFLVSWRQRCRPDIAGADLGRRGVRHVGRPPIPPHGDRRTDHAPGRGRNTSPPRLAGQYGAANARQTPLSDCTSGFTTTIRDVVEGELIPERAEVDHDRTSRHHEKKPSVPHRLEDKKQAKKKSGGVSPAAPVRQARSLIRTSARLLCWPAPVPSNQRKSNTSSWSCCATRWPSTHQPSR